MTAHGDSLVPRARDNIAEFFLNSTRHEYLLSLDSDLDFLPEDLTRLAKLASDHTLDFLVGKYAVKSDEARWCVDPLPGEVPDPAIGLQRIGLAPGGFTLVHRRVFEEMIKQASWWPHWRVAFNEDLTNRARWHFYFDGVVLDTEYWPDKPRGRYLSEDWGFSYFARRLGFTLWLDTQTIALHRGETYYPLGARRMTADEAAPQ
mgnify:FL=1